MSLTDTQIEDVEAEFSLGEDLSEKERLTAGKVCCYLVKIGVSVYGRGVVHDL